MITVRFPNGQAVQYNDGHHIDTRATFHYVCTKQDTWIAMVPLQCIIEISHPCRVYNPLTDSREELVAQEVKRVSRKIDRALRKGKR